jgi:predicted TIM-barrel fold metal-dependent hydrolase
MTSTHTSEKLAAADIRSRLNHPVIDADAHIIEFGPALDAYLTREGLPKDWGQRFIVSQNSEEIRHEIRRGHMSPLSITSNTYDLATAVMPNLLAGRLDDLGIDFAMLYPTHGLRFFLFERDEWRQAACRAENKYLADATADVRDRVRPVAVIPMGTPTEALEELDYAVNTLGYKAIFIGGPIDRPTPGVPEELLRETGWLDTFGIDSLYDYDPFWAKCEEYGLVVAEHTLGMGVGTRRSPSNYVYNQIGHFAYTGEAICKSLFLGGVTARFPKLNFAFLEGGVGWATALYGDLVNRWKKRNPQALERYQMSQIDRPLFDELLAEYGEELAKYGNSQNFRSGPKVIENDFGRTEITRVEDFSDRFVKPFYFGCEADHPTTKLAFDTSVNPLGATLQPLFSSDIGHWDVPDVGKVLNEAYEQIEHGWLNEDEFREFTCENVVKMYTVGNPDFFKGTRVEDAVKPFIATS